MVLYSVLCSEDWHEPIKCDLLKKWKKKCDDDSETSNWIAANTKECPKCRITIEKDGGCNHMVWDFFLIFRFRILQFFYLNLDMQKSILSCRFLLGMSWTMGTTWIFMV